METLERQKQLGVAQKNYRQRRKREGDIRIQFYIKKDINEKIIMLSQKKGVPKLSYMLSLLKNAVNNKGSNEAAIVSESEQDNNYSELSKSQLMAIIKKQQFWLNRLQQVNDALMK